jgi:periplasmic nitrate reductase NapD
MNVSSIVVRTRPEELPAVLAGLRSIEQCEVHFHDEQGRIIVTIEGADTGSEPATRKNIQKVPHVVSAEVVFAYSEHELAEAFRSIERSGTAVPKRLKD